MYTYIYVWEFLADDFDDLEHVSRVRIYMYVYTCMYIYVYTFWRMF